MIDDLVVLGGNRVMTGRLVRQTHESLAMSAVPGCATAADIDSVSCASEAAAGCRAESLGPPLQALWWEG